MKAYYYHPADEREILLLDESQVETKKLCETYNDYGQKCDCYAAGCYSIDNSESDFIRDLKKAIDDKFGFIPAYDLESLDGETAYIQFDSSVDDADIEKIDTEPIEEFINEWIKENTYHCEACVFEYFDGSNWRSLGISGDGIENPDLEAVEDELNEKIIVEYEEADWSGFDFGKKNGESESFTFLTTQFTSDFSIAQVFEK